MDRTKNVWRVGEHKTGWRSSLLFGKDKTRQSRQDNGPSSLTSVATSRAYRAYNKFERGKEKGRERMREEEERKQRGKDSEDKKDKKGKSKVCYDSTGPNDQRYYVDISNDFQSLQENVLLKLLQQDVKYSDLTNLNNNMDNLDTKQWQDKIGESSASSGFGTRSAQSSPGSSKSSHSIIMELRKEANKSCVHCGNLQAGTGQQQQRAHNSKSHQQASGWSETSRFKYSSLLDINTKDTDLLVRDQHPPKKGKSSFNLSPVIPDPDYDLENELDCDRRRPYSQKTPPACEHTRLMSRAQSSPRIHSPPSKRGQISPAEKTVYNTKSQPRTYSPSSREYSVPRDSLSPPRRVSPPKDSPRRLRSTPPKDSRGALRSTPPRDSLSPPRDYSPPPDYATPPDSLSPSRERKSPQTRKREPTSKSSPKTRSSGRKDDVPGFGVEERWEVLATNPRRDPGVEDRRDATSNLLWSNANRYLGSAAQDDERMPTKTLKEALKNRPSVSEFVKEITKASEKDRQREMERKLMERAEEGKEETEEEEAKKIYREIMEVVSLSSPSSIQTVKGRMVGYGEETQHTANKKEKGKKNSSQHNLAKIRVQEDRESITTSLDSYPFAPTSPWNHGVPSRYNRFGYPVFPEKQFGLPSPTGPVSFSGFSPVQHPGSQLSSLTSQLGPTSLNNPSKPKKKKGFWKHFF